MVTFSFRGFGENLGTRPLEKISLSVFRKISLSVQEKICLSVLEKSVSLSNDFRDLEK